MPKMNMSRRTLLLATATTSLATMTPYFVQNAGAQEAKAQDMKSLEYGAVQAFSFENLIARAKTMATKAYAPPAKLNAEILEKIDYDAHGKIRFNPEKALFAPPGEAARKYPVTFFHLGRYFQKPVRMFDVQAKEANKADGAKTGREILYREDYFTMPVDSPAHHLPKGAGFAGFRFSEPVDGRLDWKKNDWVAFLGASYFRAIGELYQYGLSARGIMVDAASPKGPEEFPDFTEFWIEQGKGAEEVVVYALLDGPSLSGAYKFIMKRGKNVVMEIEKHLFIRKNIERFGVAPLTSMFWFSETEKSRAVDWRPEVHDSDGLALFTGAGERMWRPLNNPPRTMASSFMDNNPRGFGLLQRDRNFDHYQDGVYYERRPSLWVEPLNSWGEGAVQLIEIPTDDEIHDNIVAAFVPKKPVLAGDAYSYKYRLHWVADEPYPTPLARVQATRLGNGGQPGTARPKGVRKFLIEFKGEPLVALPAGVKPEAVLSASRGTFSYVITEAVPNDVPGHWRAQFDLTTEGNEPVEMRCFLKLGDKVLSETWSYQYHPF